MLKEEGMKRGFKHVESGPLVRSSYHAHEQVQAASNVYIQRTDHRKESFLPS